MADSKISALPVASTPLAGTETLPIVQGGITEQVSVANLTAGRAVSMLSMTATSTGLIGNVTQQGIFDVGISGATSTQYLTGGVGNNAATGVYKIGSGANRGASVQGFRGASSNVHHLDLYSYNSADVQVMRMDSNGDAKVISGNLVISTSGKGIDFSATAGTGTSELLADYEEGTFTAVITMDSGTATVSSTNDLMSYTKVGRLVTINGQFGISATSTPSGAMKITLPFSVANGSEGAAFSVGGAMRIFNQVLPTGLYPIIQANNNDNTATFFMVTSAGTLTNMLPIVDGFFMISLTYIT